MLLRLSEWLAERAVRRHALFLGATLFTLVFVGYHYGTFDQTIHIPFLKKYADPSLYPGDRFFDLRFQHYSFFWFMFLPFYRAGVLAAGMFVVHILVTYGTFWMLWSLSETLLRSPLASLFSFIAFLFPHVGFAGFPIIEFSLLNRTFVLPFLLLAMVLYFRRRYWLAYGLVGAVYNLHVISAQFVLAMFLLDGFMTWRRTGLRHLIPGPVFFVVAAAPVLLWKLGASPVDLTPRPDWFSTVALGTLYNLFYLLPPYPHILILTMSGVSALVLFAIGRQSRPAGPHDERVTHFVWAALIILCVQVITAQWLPVTIIIQSQIIRAGLFILIFGYLYFGRSLAERYMRPPHGQLEQDVLLWSYWLSTLAVAPVLVWLLQRNVSSRLWRRIWTTVTLAVVIAGTSAVVITYDVWSPGVHANGPNTPWDGAQRWARDNTPREALFITPPQIWWLYQSDWRVFSERSTVATLSELLEAAFVPEYIAIWQPRFADVAPGAQERFRGNFFENRSVTAAAFYSLTTADFARLAEKYGADYLVVEKPNAYDFDQVYQNDGFTIYHLTHAASASSP